MQEAKVQSQYSIYPSLITVQDVEKKLKCPHGNPAFILCTDSQCQQPKGIICRTNDCKCNNLHPNCHSVQLNGILTKLHKRQHDILQDIQKSYKVARQSINTMIKQLSEVRNRLQMQQKYFGLQECELSFMRLIEEQNFQKVCGKFISELEKTLKCKKQIYMKPNKRILYEFQETKAKFDSLCEYIQNSIMKLVPRPYANITPEKQSRGLKDGDYVIDNTNNNVCIKNTNGDNWLCSSSLPFDGEFVFTIKVLKLTGSITIGVMEEEKKGEKDRDTWNYSVYLNPKSQNIRRPNQEQTDQQEIKCSCSLPLPKCPFQIECHVNRQQNTIAWHYDGKQQAKSILPKAWKTNKKSLCAIFWVSQKGNSVEMMSNDWNMKE